MRTTVRSNLGKYGIAAVIAFALAGLVGTTTAQDPSSPRKTAKKGTSVSADPKATKTTKPAAMPKVAPPGPIDPFWAQPEQRKVWDLDHLTTEDEAQLGADLNQAILHDDFHHALKTGPLPRRLEAAAEPYLKVGSRPEVEYTFTVLDCEFSNIFSTPGGFIYICRGTFDWIDDEEDYVLEFMILHEMAHVDLAHQIINMRDPAVKRLNLGQQLDTQPNPAVKQTELGTVPLFYSLAIPFGNTATQELEADKWAWEKMIKQGRSRYQIQGFLRKLEDYSKKNGFENFPLKPTDGFEHKPPKPTDPPQVPPLDNHIRAHVVPYKRMKALKTLMEPSLKPQAAAK